MQTLVWWLNMKLYTLIIIVALLAIAGFITPYAWGFSLFASALMSLGTAVIGGLVSVGTAVFFRSA